MFQKYIKNSISDKNKGIKSSSFQISQQCITVLCRIPSILSCQYPVCTILFYLFQLFAKRCASFCIRPLSPIFIFSIKYCFLGFFLIPVVPTFGSNMLSQLTMYENRLCIRSPRTRQIHLPRPVTSGQPATDKHIAITLPFICGRSRHISVCQTMNDTILEKSSRPPEDKIHRTFYIAILVELSTRLAVSIKRILIAQKAAILKIGAITADKTGRQYSQKSDSRHKSPVHKYSKWTNRK